MTKSKKSAKAATQFGEPLTLTITIPAKVVPLFQAMAALKIAQQPSHRQPTHAEYAKGQRQFVKREPMHLEDVAAHAVMLWVSSEEAMECIDKAVNALLQSED